MATLNGRTPNALRDQVTAEFLRRLFASITQQYVTCDGQVMNGGPLPLRSFSEEPEQQM